MASFRTRPETDIGARFWTGQEIAFVSDVGLGEAEQAVSMRARESARVVASPEVAGTSYQLA